MSLEMLNNVLQIAMAVSIIITTGMWLYLFRSIVRSIALFRLRLECTENELWLIKRELNDKA